MIYRAALRHFRRLRHPRFGSYLPYTTTAKPGGEFFNANSGPKTIPDAIYRDENQLKLQIFVNSRKQFYNSGVNFVASPHNNVNDVIFENTFEPTQTWEEITINNRTLKPVAGSIIEFYDFETDESALAVVLRELQSKFNENHNKLVVLTLKNELKRVYPQDINFIAYQVFDAEWVSSLDILYHRFMEDYPLRLQMVDILSLFIEVTESFHPLVKNELRRLYANVASSDHANSTSLLSITNLIKTPHLQSYYHQAALLMAIHLEMCRDVTRWMVLLCLPKQTTNLASLHCSNDIPQETIYFANSLNNYDAITDFLSYSDDKLELFRKCVQSLLDIPKDYDELILFLTIWQGKPYMNAFKLMMFALIYPHSRLMSRIHTVIASSQDEFKTRLTEVESLLHRVGILNNPKNPLTDVILSANISGRPSLDQLAVASPKDLKPSMPEIRSAQMLSLGLLKDNFTHLRNKKLYYPDHTIYMLPSEDGYPRIGVSVEKLNTRKYLINIHVPDVVTRLSPSSAAFDEISKHSFSLFGLRNLIDQNQISLLAKNVRDLLISKGNIKEVKYVNVSDSSPQEITKLDRTCMTVSFEYNTFALSPLKKLENGVSISFDNIGAVAVKELSLNLLDDAISGRLEPSILRPFKLFNKTQKEMLPKLQPVLNEKDLLNLGFLFGSMKTHYGTRKLRCASSPLPTSFKRLISRQLTYAEHADRDEINTNLVLASAEDGKVSNALYFIQETKLFLDSLVSAYCQREGIPAFARGDDLLDSNDEEGQILKPEDADDEVLISHENILLPNYYCNSYYQAILAKDGNGFLSLPAFFIGNNYLGKQALTLTRCGPSLLRLGLPGGRVNVSDAIDSVEAYLNQLQILSHINLQHTRSSSYLGLVKKSSPLKSLGYPVHGPLSDKILRKQVSRLQDSELGSRYISDRHNRYWKLKYLEQKLSSQGVETMDGQASYQSEETVFTCVITSLGHDIDLNQRLVRGWCVELGMEVDLLAHFYNDLTIGSTVKGNKVLYLNAIEGICILQYRDEF